MSFLTDREKVKKDMKETVLIAAGNSSWPMIKGQKSVFITRHKTRCCPLNKKSFDQKMALLVQNSNMDNKRITSMSSVLSATGRWNQSKFMMWYQPQALTRWWNHFKIVTKRWFSWKMEPIQWSSLPISFIYLNHFYLCYNRGVLFPHDTQAALCEIFGLSIEQ